MHTSKATEFRRVEGRPARRGLTRRSLMAGAAGWVLAGAAAPLSRPVGAARAAATELPHGDWGAIVSLSEGVWAVASTPLAHRDFTTVCNGGIVAGAERVLVVEAFAGAAGARRVAEAALELTGRWPTDVVLTHYHGDHTGGLAGLVRGGRAPRLHATRATLDRLAGADDGPEARARAEMIAGAHVLAEGGDFVLELGGGPAVLGPYAGHTASDVIVELPERGLAFGGDLLWSGMIPNFVDARPIELSSTLRALRDREPQTWVPGHGVLGEPRLVELNLELASIFEQLARRSFESGVSAAEAASRAALPAPFDSWVAFSPSYVERAIAAWHRDLAD